jgi:hypothetical protein
MFRNLWSAIKRLEGVARSQKRSGARRRNRVLLYVEEFEKRCVPANFTVKDLGDNKVDPAAGDKTGTLRQAIIDANASNDASSTITFNPGLVGTITLTRALPVLKKNITITGAGWGNIAVDRSATAPLFPIFSLAQNVNCEIDNLAIGYGSSGIVMLQGSSLYLDGVTVFGSSSSGIVNNDGSLVMTNCTVSENSNANGFGGGIQNDQGSVALLDCDVSWNSAEMGGGIANMSATSLLSITDSDVDGNTATKFGGGIWNQGSLNWNGGSLSANAAGAGGGLFADMGGIRGLTLTGVSITANEATRVGGGFYVLNGDVTLNTVPLARNTATTAPGGAFVKGSVSNNNPPNGNQAIEKLNPGVGALMPNTGAVTGGTAVALFGQRFDTATAVSFGGTLATFQVVSDDEIIAVAPAESAGTVDVTVANSAGSSDTSPADLFTFSSSLTNTTVALTSSASSTTYGQALTLTAAVSSNGSTTPTGSVTFYTNCGTALGTTAVNNAGVATLTLSSLAADDEQVTGVYTGDGNDAGAAATLGETVSQASTTTTLTTSASSAQAGTPVTLTATVTSPTATPAGSVDFWLTDPTTGEDEIFLGAAAVAGNGQATLTLSTLPPGANVIEADFDGGRDFLSSSDTLTQTITTNPTVTAVLPATGASSGTPILLVGQYFTGATAVSFGGTTATSYSVLSDSEILAVAPALPPGAVDVTVTTAAGTSATSAADLFTASSSLTNPTLAVSSSAGTTTYGQAVTLTATLSAGSGTPTGSVSFLDGCGTVLGTAAVNDSGVATLTLSSLPAGSDQLVAVYSGDPNFAGAAATLAQTVSPAGTTTTLTSSASSTPVGTAVTLTATVTATTAAPATGLVFFWQVDPVSGADLSLLGVSAVGSSGQATLTLSTLSIGSDAVQAMYLADPDFNSSSGTLTQTMTAGSTTLVIDSTVTLDGGALAGYDAVEVAAGGTLVLEDGAVVSAPDGVLVDAGATLTGYGGTIDGDLANAGTVALGQPSTGTFTVTGNYVQGGSATLTVTGGPMQVDGTVAEDGGTVQLGWGGTLTVAGNYALAGGGLALSGGTLTALGLLDASGGTLTLTAGTLTGSVQVDAGGSLTATGGTLNGDVSNFGAVTASALTVTGDYGQSGTASLDLSSGSVTVDGSFEEDGGSVQVGSGGMLNADNGVTQTGGDLSLAGGMLSLGTGAFDQSGGTTEVTGLSSLYAMTMTLGGTVTLEGGSVTAMTAAEVLSGGVLILDGGTLSGDMDGVLVDAGATLTAYSGTISGNLANAGSVTLGDPTTPGTLTVMGGYTQATGTLAATNGSLTANSFAEDGGAVVVGSGGTVTTTGWTQTGGDLALSGTGAVHDNGMFQQSGGTTEITDSATLNAYYLSIGGTLTLAGGSLSTGMGTVEVRSGGLLLVDSGSISSSMGGVQVDSGGTLTAYSGTIAGNLSNLGTINLGDPTTAGTLAVSGNCLLSMGTLDAYLGGTASGLYSQLSVGGQVTFGGTLDVSAINGFQLAPGNAFTLLNYGSASGTFATLGLPALSTGSWDPVYNNVDTFTLEVTS